MSPSNIWGTPTPSEVGGSTWGGTRDPYYTPLQVRRDTIMLDEDKMEVDMTSSKLQSYHCDKAYKVQKLDFFYRDYDKLDNWVNQLWIYFEFNNIEPGKQTLFILIYLQGRVEYWMRPYISNYFNKDKEILKMITSFREFLREIHKIFGKSNKK
jgi:hypothetical protein